jgi:hypothetical protein
VKRIIAFGNEITAGARNNPRSKEKLTSAFPPLRYKNMMSANKQISTAATRADTATTIQPAVTNGRPNIRFLS